MRSDGFWVRTALFDEELGAEPDADSGCYGEMLANWIATALRGRGVSVEQVLSEDWGWCVVIYRRPFLLWIGCGYVPRHPGKIDNTWHCFAVAEAPFWKAWVRWSRAAEIRSEISRINSMLSDILSDCAEMQLVSEA